MLMLMKISKRGAHQNAAAIQHYIPSPTFYYDQPHISINLSIVSYKSIIKSGMINSATHLWLTRSWIIVQKFGGLFDDCVTRYPFA